MPIWDTKKGAERPVTARDIVVLLRSVKSNAESYARILKQSGIDSFVEESDGYFDTMEIGVFMDLLAVIDNRRQDIPLISVLHAEIFGFSAAELAAIRARYPKRSFAEAFLACAGQGAGTAGQSAGNTGQTAGQNGQPAEQDASDPLAAKCRQALATLDAWRQMARVMPLPAFLWKLMTESSYYLIMGAMPGGARRQANLRALIEKAEAFGKERQATLYGFLRYADLLRKREVKTPEARLVGEGDDVVRIMTIHKSKGLEFPVVIVAGLGRRLRNQGKTDGVVLHREIGIGLSRLGPEGIWRRRTLLQILISRCIAHEEQEEEVRVLYVALTRAKDQLHLTGTVKDGEKYLEERSFPDPQGSTFLKMIGTALPCHLVAASDLDARELEEQKRVFGDLVGRDDLYAGEPSPQEREKLLKILRYRYPFTESRKLRSKYSVSELNEGAVGAIRVPDPNRPGRMANQAGADRAAYTAGSFAPGGAVYPAEPLAVPDFAAGESALTAARRGTVYHCLLEHISFRQAAAGGRLYLEETARNLIAAGLITAEELAAVDLGKIEAFLTSELGQRAAAAEARGDLRREQPFTLRVREAGEDVLVQGIIDCWFREGDHTVLIDYKSNAAAEEADPQRDGALLERYRLQLLIYRRALEEAGYGPVRETYLFLLAAGRAIDAQTENVL
ncbi:MAG: PD-(D/E)XK nuclease family protein [Clostridia bacterium]|nr:PD-(D/E)XK nuclease family protein [Clostridia bacterium]